MQRSLQMLYVYTKSHKKHNTSCVYPLEYGVGCHGAVVWRMLRGINVDRGVRQKQRTSRCVPAWGVTTAHTTPLVPHALSSYQVVRVAATVMAADSPRFWSFRHAGHLQRVFWCLCGVAVGVHAVVHGEIMWTASLGPGLGRRHHYCCRRWLRRCSPWMIVIVMMVMMMLLVLPW